MWIDTHCHFDNESFDLCRSELATQLKSLRIEKLVIPATNVHDFAKVAEISYRYNYFYTLGVHPLFSHDVDPLTFDDMRLLVRNSLSDKAFLGIGEIGLDFATSNLDKNKQIGVFVDQLKIAREFDLPVICHGVGAVDLIHHYLKIFGVTKGILHAFNGSFQQAENLMRQGMKLGFGGMVLYPLATRIRKLVEQLPDEVIVLETDAPYSPFFWNKLMRSKFTNFDFFSPEVLILVAEAIAELRGKALSELAILTARNANEVFLRLTQVSNFV